MPFLPNLLNCKDNTKLPFCQEICFGGRSFSGVLSFSAHPEANFSTFFHIFSVLFSARVP